MSETIPSRKPVYVVETITVPQLWTIPEARENTGLSYDKLRKLCAQGRVRFIRSGRRFLINARSLCEYLETGDEPPEVQTAWWKADEKGGRN